jgi:3-keto-disaccharide hydrolase
MKATTKIIFSGVILFCLAFTFAGCKTSQAQTSTNAVELFNGKDFSGWTFYMRSNAAPEKTWSIFDGMIHCTGVPTGYMRTEKIYHDFKVTAEWRFPATVKKSVNTGVLVFMQDRDPNAPAKQIWPHCVECQGMHDHMGDFWLQGGTTAKEAVNMGKNGIKMLLPSNESPVGEWTTFTCICKGNTVEIVVNGKSMNKITGVDVSSGYIGIQSEGGPFDLRKVSVEPLQ